MLLAKTLFISHALFKSQKLHSCALNKYVVGAYDSDKDDGGPVGGAEDLQRPHRETWPGSPGNFVFLHNFRFLILLTLYRGFHTFFFTKFHWVIFQN